MKEFDFVDDLPLRENMEGVLFDVFALRTLLENQEEPRVRSCLRKTIIIYLASIIEKLLLWKLKKEVVSEKVVLSDEWKYVDIRSICIHNDFEVISGKRKRGVEKVDRLDFNRILQVCSSRGVINDEDFIADLHKVRELRNEVHIGGLEAVRKSYTKRNLHFVFDMLEKTMRAVVQDALF